MNIAPQSEEELLATIKCMRKRIRQLERERSQNGMQGHTNGYLGRICLDQMCNFMSNEDDDDHRCYKDIPLQELVFDILHKIITNDTRLAEFHSYCIKLIESDNPTGKNQIEL